MIVCLLALVKLLVFPLPHSTVHDELTQTTKQTQQQNSFHVSKLLPILQKNQMITAKQNKDRLILVDNFTNISYDVHTFYYPWYGIPSHDGRYIHWNHKTIKHWQPDIAARFPEVTHLPPHDIGASFFPQLGCYSSKDETAIRTHSKQISSAGIGVLVVSWFFPSEHDDNGESLDKLFPLLLKITGEKHLKIAFHLEPYQGRSVTTIKRDLEYISNTYGTHPALYRINKLPVYYVYDSYQIVPEEWAKLFVCDGNTACIRNTNLDGVFFGLAVEEGHLEHLKRGGFDGIYTYFAVDGFSYGSTMQNWARISQFAAGSKLLLSISVGPGYDDEAVRPWNGANTRSRNYGDYYDDEWKVALAAKPSFISITSFNEWHEGTQIEPAIPFRKYKDYLPKDPEYYLRKTFEWARLFRPNHFRPQAYDETVEAS